MTTFLNLPPEDAICPNHKDRPAEYEITEAMGRDPLLADLLGDGGAYFQTVWVCGECADE